MKPHSSTTVFSMALTCLFLLTCSVFANAQTAATSQQRNLAVTERVRMVPQITPLSQLQVSGKTAGKLHMVVTLLETKPAYSRGISSDQFIRKVLGQMYPAPIPPWLVTYLSRVYEYHVKGMTPDAVYAADDGRAFAELYNSIASRYKPGMTKAEFERQLVPGASSEPGDPVANKPKWINALRKIIDIIDDLWPED